MYSVRMGKHLKKVGTQIKSFKVLSYSIKDHIFEVECKCGNVITIDSDKLVTQKAYLDCGCGIGRKGNNSHAPHAVSLKIGQHHRNGTIRYTVTECFEILDRWDSILKFNEGKSEEGLTVFKNGNIRLLYLVGIVIPSRILDELIARKEEMQRFVDKYSDVVKLYVNSTYNLDNIENA